MSSAHHLVLWHEQDVGCLSMNRLISQGHAIRSTRAFSRVTHFMRLPYLRLLVWSSAALRACASFTGSAFAQKCM